MKFTEANIREYIRTHPGFIPSDHYHADFEVLVQTLVDMTNFFVKIAADTEQAAMLQWLENGFRNSK